MNHKHKDLDIRNEPGWSYLGWKIRVISFQHWNTRWYQMFAIKEGHEWYSPESGKELSGNSSWDYEKSQQSMKWLIETEEHPWKVSPPVARTES